MVSVVVLTITVTPVPGHHWLQPGVLTPSVLLIIVVIASLADGRPVREDSSVRSSVSDIRVLISSESKKGVVGKDTFFFYLRRL